MANDGADVTFLTAAASANLKAWCRQTLNLTSSGGMIASTTGHIYQVDHQKKVLYLDTSFPPGRPEHDYARAEKVRVEVEKNFGELGYDVIDRRPKEATDAAGHNEPTGPGV